MLLITHMHSFLHVDIYVQYTHIKTFLDIHKHIGKAESKKKEEGIAENEELWQMAHGKL